MTQIRDHARVLDDTSRERLPRGKDLWPGVREHIQKGHTTPMKPAAKLRLAALLLALILLLAFFALPGVAAALKHFFGYIPGVGKVDTTVPLRVLAEPVSDSRDGFAITVESALIDSTQTVIQYRITGPFPVRENDSPGSDLCQESSILRMADGSQLTYPTGEWGGGNGEMSYKDTFRAMPADQNQATLILPCVRGQLLGEKPLTWEIPLHFAPAPDGMPVYPVVELPSPTPPLTGEAPFENGFSLSIEEMAETPDGYYLKARLRWQADPSFYDVEPPSDAVRVVDSAGQAISIWDISVENSEDQSWSISLKIGTPSTPGPVQVIVDYVGISLYSPTENTLILDLGESPQPGQTWQINQDVTVQGYTVRVLSAEYFQEGPQAPTMLMLYLQAKPEVLMARFLDFETENASGGGAAPNSEYANFRSAISYQQFPQGKVKLTLANLSIRRDGPWSVTWAPPTVDPNTAPRQLASPVTDTRDGFTITVKNVVLNATGSTVTYLLTPSIESKPGSQTGLCNQQTSLRLADGREKISTAREGYGTDSQIEYVESFPAFRADETPVSLVISCVGQMPTGEGPQNWEILLQFVDGAPVPLTPIPTIAFLPGKACLDQATIQAALDGPQAPLPAGLGGKMAFWQGNDDFSDMFLSNLDGSDRQALGAGIFPALSPDGQSLVYRGADTGLHIRDLTSGSDFVVPGSIQPKTYNNEPAWSPDGQQIAFTRFANENFDVYLVNADGSNLRGIVTGPKQENFLGWAPDSRSIAYRHDEGSFLLDLQSGAAREMGALPPGTNLFFLSPDGKRSVFGNDQGIFITSTSDFAPTLLFNSSLNLNLPLVWSPDSQWLALGYWGADGEGPARLLLLQPDTCQFILFQEARGILSSWVR